MKKKWLYPLVLTPVAAVLALPIIGQAQDADLTAQAFIDGLEVTEPDLAETSLVIEDRFASPDGRKLVVRVRNQDWRTITAWAVEFVFGTAEGHALHSVHAADYYVTLLDEKPGDRSAIRPGDSQELEYELPDSYILSDNRFAQGDYSVATAKVRAVVFDDGTFAGSDLQPVQYILKQRYARAVALARMLDRVDSAQRAGGFESVLRQHVEAAAQTPELQPELLEPPQGTARFDLNDFVQRQEQTVGQQWEMAVQRASWNEAAALGNAPRTCGHWTRDPCHGRPYAEPLMEQASSFSRQNWISYPPTSPSFSAATSNRLETGGSNDEAV